MKSLAFLSLLLALATSARGDEVTGDQFFVRRIAPLLQEKCLACHGTDAAKIQGGLDLRSRTGLLRGGESERPAIVPGKPEESPLLMAVTRTHDDWSAMPPKEADKLSVEQVGWIRAWIAGGASWPDAARSKQITVANEEKWSAEDGVVVASSGGLSPDWTTRKYKLDGLWAYQPVRHDFNGPEKKSDRQVENKPHVIDELLAAKRPTGLKLAPRAEAIAFIRRATFDLTGLPPTPEEVAAFVREFDRSNGSNETYESLVNRLLDSPHYGERMAQHWLDVVRYADSSGFANDFERGNAWRYRDYVVRSFNSDKPYDHFIREQIAGDEIDSTNPELLVATGFLRMGPWELTGMEVAKVARQRFLDDVTNSVGETFLAHSLQCARCHDHKFDPIPTRDYYAVQAVFATTQLAERPAPFLPTENLAGFDERRFLEMRRADYAAMLEKLDEQMLASAQIWFQDQRLDSAGWNAAVERIRQQDRTGKRGETGGVFNAARSQMLTKGIPEDQFPPKLLGFSPTDFGNERVARKGLERLRWELERYEPFALAVYSGRTPTMKGVFTPLRMPANRLTEGELEETCILTGGDPFASGAKVKPGVLSVIAENAIPFPRAEPISRRNNSEIPTALDGRRRAFAEWVARKDNPLTTRAIANRVWLWHFNQPLAGNPNNFGSTGKRPTHPELLDWLAATFVADGWSFKSLHRQIMNSEAYRCSARHPAPDRLAELDPLGTSYAAFRPRRLTAEELRDAMLAATGELNVQLGGIPNRPEINLEAALQPRQVMGTFAAAWVPNPLPSQRHRRSLYALKLRGLVDPHLEVFNAPASDFSCERREASTVTPQVFSLFNGQASHSRALALASRVIHETTSDELAITRCFELALSRRPSADERQLCLAHWREIEALLDETTVTAAVPPQVIRREAVEENTGERFSFEERLHANAEFVADLQPNAVNRRVRALADVCLALFNSNEFAYVD